MQILRSCFFTGLMVSKFSSPCEFRDTLSAVNGFFTGVMILSIFSSVEFMNFKSHWGQLIPSVHYFMSLQSDKTLQNGYNFKAKILSFWIFQTFLQNSWGKNSITQTKNSRFRQIHLVYLPKIGRIKKPGVTSESNAVMNFSAIILFFCQRLLAK